jgi:hypothetical protein
LIRVQEDYGLKTFQSILGRNNIIVFSTEKKTTSFLLFLLFLVYMVLHRKGSLIIVLMILLNEDFMAGEGTALSNLSVNLLQHSTHNVPRRDAEHLVRQGYLECEIVGDPHCSGRGQ